MKSQFYFLFTLLTFIFSQVSAQYVDMSMVVVNKSSGGDGSTAIAGQMLTYTIVVVNKNPTQPISNVRLFVDMPFGTTYVPGTTRNEDWSTSTTTQFPDVNGKMPFLGSGGGSFGTLAGGATIRMKFDVLIGATGGTLSTHATFKGVQTNENLYETVTSAATGLYFNPLSLGLYGVFNNLITQGQTATYAFLRAVNLNTGGILSQGTVYYGTLGLCQDVDGTPLSDGSLLSDGRALALDSRNNRLYFTNKTLNENLSYIDLSVNPPVANVFANTPYSLQSDAVSNDEVINRMAFAADNKGYALTSNGQKLIRFEVPESGNSPVTITPLGPLVNDPLNGPNDVLAESEGDLFGDSDGKLYLITGLAKLYKIVPNTRVATYLGTISNLTAGTTITAAAEAATSGFAPNSIGGIYLAGYRPFNSTSTNITYSTFKLDMATMSATLLSNAAITTVTATMDYGGGIFTPHYHYITATQHADQTDNFIDYTIEVTNSGNINAAGVRVSDLIPNFSTYVAGSTTLNGVLLPDVAGEMPFAVTGGTLIPGADVPGILKPGDGNKAIIRFRVKTELDGFPVCHQAQISYFDMDNNPLTIAAAPKTNNQVPEEICTLSRSGARKANVDTVLSPAKVRPNPFSDNLYIQVELAKNENVLIRLTDLQGRVVYTSKEALSAGVNNLNIVLKNDLPHGVYIIEVLAGNKSIIRQKLEKL